MERTKAAAATAPSGIDPGGPCGPPALIPPTRHAGRSPKRRGWRTGVPASIISPPVLPEGWRGGCQEHLCRQRREEEYQKPPLPSLSSLPP